MSHILKEVKLKALHYICQITVSGQKRQPWALVAAGITAYTPMGCGPSVKIALPSAQEMEFGMHEVDVCYTNSNCFTTKSCDLYIKSNLMKNGSKFESRYQPCLAIGPVLSNPWKWQAGGVGRASKTHFSHVLTVLVIRVPNKGQDWRFFLASQPTLQGRGKK